MNNNIVTVKTIGERIRFYRLKGDPMTQAELGECIGLSWFRIAEIERNVAPVSAEQLEKIAFVLSVPVRKLTENSIIQADRKMRSLLRLMASSGCYIDMEQGEPDLVNADGGFIQSVPKTTFQQLVGGAFVEEDRSGKRYFITDEGRAELHY